MKDAQTPPTLPPGPPPLPILGNTLAFRRDPLRFLRTMQQYGPHKSMDKDGHNSVK